MTRTHRAVPVEILDYKLLEAACKEHGLAEPSYGGNGIIRRRIDGAPVIISTEGVCSTNIVEGMVALDTQWFDDWQYLPIEAAEACRTGEIVDLSQHIRVFGSRLDINVADWAAWAKAEAL